ncbi:MORC family CW-type zinc finger protein 3a [Pempheris klunzingeri]|uniref:MORC family CW-type zinc finger protein 3a n=1 Tax=Pempheris klunzingeri TaxID=3127111 RepID=UPI003981283C
MAAQTQRGVPFSTLCPKYLHTNSTSHTSPFSAIAELIDNAYDPDVSAKQFWIDKTIIQTQECLTFMDNGEGLDHEKMHKMLSFGYSDKTAVNGQHPIGMYGNGFKSGSMRLGRDAIVFSKSKTVSCIGMLSQTYLEKIEAKQIIVPIVCFEQEETNNFIVREEDKASLQDILHYSPFTTQKELVDEINAISSLLSTGKTGTRIIIWNLRRRSDGETEFDFEKNRYDIQIPSAVYEAMNDSSQYSGVTSCTPECVYSLRAYCSILYLKPRMQVIIRGHKVKTQLIAKSLAYIRRDYYKPTFLLKRIPITFGYNTKSKDQYGIMMYHKNRLIKAYERVGCQLKADRRGVGVIGVVECFFLEPTHNKQSFNETDKYRKTMTNLGIKLEEYWHEIRHRRNNENPNSIPVEDTVKQPDQNWAQCDDCLKWRKLPDGIDCSKLPDKWYCRMNPDPQFRSCQVEEEPEDSDEDQPSYRKTYKEQEREEKRKQERQRKKEEEEQRRQKACLANLNRENQALKVKHENLQQKPIQTPVRSSTPNSRFAQSPQRGAKRAISSTISQAVCSTPSNNGLPVISSVRSLSAGTPRGKRVQLLTPETTPKRQRVNGLDQGTSNTSVDVIQLSCKSVSMDYDVDTDDTDDTDDDIFILETASTPKPAKPSFNLSKVKTENEKSDANVGVPVECSDGAAVASAANVATMAAVCTAASPASPAEVVSTTTQTEVHTVKVEKEDQRIPEEEERAKQSTSTKSGKEQSSNVDTDVCSRVIHQPDSEDAGPSCADVRANKYSPLHHPIMIEVQEQQDQLLELMQATAQERDSFKEQVHKLTGQLQDMQSRLQELSQDSVKKECSYSQSEQMGGAKDYKSLFEKTKQKINELVMDKAGLPAATETKPSTAQGEESDVDKIALQVDRLVRELDQRNKERDELRTQLDSLEEERANLASQCEELRLSLQQQRENAQEGSTTPHSVTVSSVQTDIEEAGGTADSGTRSDKHRSLIELRHNVGRLLISFVPALDLDQVNYDCSVIDEILEQVLSNEESITPSLGINNS